MQLFAEALVLAAIAAVLGLTATDFALKWALAAMSTEAEGWPFWFEGGLSATTLTYSAWLTLLAAVVAGVVPALKITRTNMEVGLRQASAGAGGIRMGGMWTAVIVAQIAGTVLFTAVAYVVQRQAAGIASAKAAFPAEEYLAVRLEMDRDGLTEERATTVDESFLRRYQATARELEGRVAAEATVAGVTLAERLPLMASAAGGIELDDAGPSESVTGRESCRHHDRCRSGLLRSVPGARPRRSRLCSARHGSRCQHSRRQPPVRGQDSGRPECGRTPHTLPSGEIRKPSRSRDRGLKSSAWCVISCQTPRLP